MSCVAAVVDDGKVWMGCDSAASDGVDMVNLVTEKMFISGDYLVGTVGSLRLTQILRYRTVFPVYDEKEILDKFMATYFSDAVRVAFAHNGFAQMAADDQGMVSMGAFLVGFKGRLFRFEGDLQVLERADGFEAIGCGGPYALGALLQSAGRMEAKQRIEGALTASTHFSAHVRPPYHIYSM